MRLGLYLMPVVLLSASPIVDTIDDILCSTGYCGTTFDYSDSPSSNIWIERTLKKYYIDNETVSPGGVNSCQTTKPTLLKSHPAIEDCIASQINGKSSVKAQFQQMGFLCNDWVCKYASTSWSIMRHSPGNPYNNKKIFETKLVCVAIHDGGKTVIASVSTHS